MLSFARFLLTVGLATALLPSGADARSGPAPEPVVVLPGLSGACNNTADNDLLAGGVRRGLATAAAASDGTVATIPAAAVHGWHYSACNRTLPQLAKQFDDYLATVQASSGGGPVDLVSFSFGGAIARYCLTNASGTTPSCARRVDDWVGVANSTHGSSLANTNTCVLAGLAGQWAVCTALIPGSGELRRMDQGDPSPGGVEYTMAWTAGDEVVFPTGSERLDGAANVELTSPRGRVTHAGAWAGGTCTTTQDWVGAQLLDLRPHVVGDMKLDCTSPLPPLTPAAPATTPATTTTAPATTTTATTATTATTPQPTTVG